MRNQMTYLENRCDQLKKDCWDAQRMKGELAEKKLNEKIFDLNNELDKKQKIINEKVREA